MTVIDDLANKIRASNRRELARAITLIESSRTDHREQAEQLLQTLLTDTGNSLRIGISGSPGVGKSTFIEALGLHIIDTNHSLAVLSIDPSSTRSGGSILGDKTRMMELGKHPQAFIRPSPSGGTLGGVAKRTRETLLLCEAAGFNTVIIETVGVGQSETAVAEMTDMFLLLVQPGGGDELQGIKRGIMELADLLIVNKADGDLLSIAQNSASDYSNALRLMQPRSKNWQTPVVSCSALTNTGINDIWQHIERYQHLLTNSGEISNRRQQQAKAWLWQELQQTLLTNLTNQPSVQSQLDTLEREVVAGRLLPTVAARELLSCFKLS